MYKIVVLLSVLLAGCVTTANYQEIVNQWQGEPAKKLVSVWGYPDSSVKLPNGNTVYLYTKQQLYTAPTYGPSVTPAFVAADGTPRYGVGFNGTFGAAQTVRLSCRTWFEVNPKGIIVNAQFRGNNCVSSNPNRLQP